MRRRGIAVEEDARDQPEAGHEGNNRQDQGNPPHRATLGHRPQDRIRPAADRSHDVGNSFLILDLNDSLVGMRTNVKSAPAKPRPTADEAQEQMRRALQTSMDTRQ